MEGFFYGVGGRVVEVYDVTNLVKDHETQFVATGFLVAMHQCEHVVERAASHDVGRPSEASNER